MVLKDLFSLLIFHFRSKWIFKYQDTFSKYLEKNPGQGRCKIDLTFDLIIEFLIKLIPEVRGGSYLHSATSLQLTYGDRRENSNNVGNV